MAQCQHAHPKRYELQCLLEKTLGSDHVYFQPPASFQLKYPCIVYELEDITPVFADDLSYLRHDSYQVTFMTHDPDSPVRHKLADLPKTRFSQFFAADNINHYVYIIYY